MRSWARLSLAAATIFIAFVIFWVFLTEAIFRLRLCKLGMDRGFDQNCFVCLYSAMACLSCPPNSSSIFFLVTTPSRS